VQAGVIDGDMPDMSEMRRVVDGRKRIDRNSAPLDVEQSRATTRSSPPRIADRPLPEVLDALRLRDRLSRSDGRGTPHDARQ
jgi:hypothetical protein